MKHITIDQFLTSAEIDRAITLYRSLAGTGKFATAIDAEIIAPNLERINKALGQDNCSLYLAFAVEYVLDKSSEHILAETDRFGRLTKTKFPVV